MPEFRFSFKTFILIVSLGLPLALAAQDIDGVIDEEISRLYLEEAQGSDESPIINSESQSKSQKASNQSNQSENPATMAPEASERVQGRESSHSSGGSSQPAVVNQQIIQVDVQNHQGAPNSQGSVLQSQKDSQSERAKVESETNEMVLQKLEQQRLNNELQLRNQVQQSLDSSDQNPGSSSARMGNNNPQSFSAPGPNLLGRSWGLTVGYGTYLDVTNITNRYLVGAYWAHSFQAGRLLLGLNYGDYDVIEGYNHYYTWPYGFPFVTQLNQWDLYISLQWGRRWQLTEVYFGPVLMHSWRFYSYDYWGFWSARAESRAIDVGLMGSVGWHVSQNVKLGVMAQYLVNLRYDVLPVNFGYYFGLITYNSPNAVESFNRLHVNGFLEVSF